MAVQLTVRTHGVIPHTALAIRSTVTQAWTSTIGAIAVLDHRGGLELEL